MVIGNWGYCTESKALFIPRKTARNAQKTLNCRLLVAVLRGNHSVGSIDTA
jgi:hypothetical protein